MENITDQMQRETALDFTKSFIIQAPAGSGKTSLLVLRILVLLTKVNFPEEIIAITFTKKAAGEMRERVIEALEQAQNLLHNFKNLESHKIKTLTLAQNVLERDKLLNWNLLANPERLRIQTIDSLCNYLVRQMPIKSGIGNLPKILDEIAAEQSYRAAIREVLTNFTSENLEKILLHLDNNRILTENLFAEMLMRREQWLPYVLGKNRDDLEKGLQNIIAETLAKTTLEFSNLPDNLNIEISELVNFATANLANTKITLEVKNDPINYHQTLAKILLTEKNLWRKKLTINEGFPPGNATNKAEKNLFTTMKNRMLALLEKLQALPNAATIKQYLGEIKNLPPENYSEQQWEIVAALLEILPLLAAELQIIFNENNTADFAAIAMAADAALGDSENPTDLALNLDYQIKHILVDEFQDTSLMQYRLLQKLTAAWEPNDAKTLFLVGDPMQSIYRFRQAEVGLFLYTQQFGLGNIRLQSLTLTQNFRAEKNLVDWVNNNFAKILPQKSVIDYGAVPFAAAFATKNSPDSKVNIKIFQNSAENAITPTAIVELINQLPKNETIAIIVRNRSHLTKIIANLKLAQIKFQAVDIEPLNENQTIIDLLTLTKALQNLNDRISWLAILRAPWCGLTLTDLHILANSNGKTIWENILQYENLALSSDGKNSLTRILPILAHYLNLVGRSNWRILVENTWLDLGGPACAENIAELDNAELFFNLLEDFLLNFPAHLDLTLFAQKLANFYASATALDANVKIMTIHSAKGLEFDHVIIPEISRRSNRSPEKLLLWMERAQNFGASNLILAPIKHQYETEDKIYQYLKSVEQQKDFFETGRLLYVATTRAKKTLHIFGEILPDEKPANGTLLQQLWPCLTAENFVVAIPEKNFTKDCPKKVLTKLADDWQHPLLNQEKFSVTKENLSPKNSLNNFFVPENTTATIIGTVVHKCIQQLSNYLQTEQIFLEHFSPDAIKTLAKKYCATNKNYWQKLLRQFGCIDNLELPLQKVVAAIELMLNDSKGKWILNLKHQNIHNEYALSTISENKIKHFVIDRMFIDELNRFWIVDFKTSSAKDLLAEKMQYQKQLEDYALAIKAKYEIEKVFLGLYFPLTSGWIEWEF